MFLHVLVACSFLLLYCTPLYGYTTICSSILLLMEIMVIFSLGLLWKSCYEHSLQLFLWTNIFVSLGNSIGELHGTCMLTSKETAELCSIVAVCSHQHSMNSPIVPRLCQLLALLVFLIAAILDRHVIVSQWITHMPTPPTSSGATPPASPFLPSCSDHFSTSPMF